MHAHPVPARQLIRRLFSKAERREPELEGSPRRAITAQERFDQRHGALMADICSFLARTGLDPLPDHFALAWFYHADGGADARRAIDDHIARHGTIGPTAAIELLDSLRTSISETELASLIDAARDNIGAAHQVADSARRDVADYGASLDRAMPGGADDADMLTDLRRLTAEMAMRAAKAEAALKARSVTMGRMKARLVESQKLALSDVLTGLPNRRSFDTLLTEATARAVERGEALSVGFCDIDHFKSVNDTHGHATGDRVIRHVAGILGRVGGSRCHVARHGGEEFALLFEGQSAEQARNELDVARERLTASRLVARDTGAEIGTVSFSGGVAELTTGETASDLLARADRALYDAKRLGRDQVRLAN